MSKKEIVALSRRNRDERRKGIMIYSIETSLTSRIFNCKLMVL